MDNFRIVVEDAEESRLVANWVPPDVPRRLLVDATVSAHWDELQRLMRQMLEAYQKDR